MISDGFPPRGSGVTGQVERQPSATWLDPATLDDRWMWRSGRFLLGIKDRLKFGLEDDRHILIVAGSRAGKTRRVIGPNLAAYPGPCIVIDPKGELVAKTIAARRKRVGPERVHVLDPFGVTGIQSSLWNPFDELRRTPEGLKPPDAAQFADALILKTGAEKDPYWTDSARNLVKGLALHLLMTNSKASIRDVLALLNASPITLGEALMEMAQSTAYDGILSNIGHAFFGLFRVDDDTVALTTPMSNILSTAQQQTSPLGDIAHVMDGSSFRLSDIGSENLTVYLVLPAMRMGSHSRWLRLFIMQALASMERNPIAPPALPVWFVLEEFAALGHIREIETAAGYIAGYGARLIAVLQDLTQLKAHYPESWETFIGNAGQLVNFGSIDKTTTEYISHMLGVTEFQHTRPTNPQGFQQRNLADDRVQRVGPLLEPHEIRIFFSRHTRRVLVISDGRALALDLLRMPEDDDACS